MQKTLVAATLAAVLGMGGSAYAADMYKGGSLKDAPVAVAAPETSWTGFYLGVGGGGGAVNHDLKFTGEDYRYDTLQVAEFGGGRSAELNGIGGDGGFVTVEVGYDRQFGRFVGGIFFNYDFTSIGSEFNAGRFSASYDLDSLWSVGGRLGYLVNPNTLAYVLGAYTQANFEASSALKAFGIGDRDYSGFTVGGGLETALGGNWFLKAEYRFTALDTETLLSECNDGCFKVTDDANIHQGRVVLSYKVGSGYEPLK
ncbi:MAG: outer membrane beta-barrel protein [Rhodomicrobium sp.]|nr:outer membrane beta-barrel protein [Rhodomicrobium sp.]